MQHCSYAVDPMLGGVNSNGVLCCRIFSIYCVVVFVILPHCAYHLSSKQSSKGIVALSDWGSATATTIVTTATDDLRLKFLQMLVSQIWRRKGETCFFRDFAPLRSGGFMGAFTSLGITSESSVDATFFLFFLLVFLCIDLSGCAARILHAFLT